MIGIGRGRGGKGRGRGNTEGRSNNSRASHLNVNPSVIPTVNKSSQPHPRPIIICKPSQRASIETQLSRNVEQSMHPSSINVNNGGG